MRKVYVISDNIISSLGFTTSENLQNLKEDFSGLKLHENKYSQIPAFYGSLVDDSEINTRFSAFGDPVKYTKLEKMAILSIKTALSDSDIDIQSPKTLVLVSTTKGNIDLLKSNSLIPKERVYLTEMSKVITSFFNNPNTPLIISNACISGVLGIITAKDLIASGLYDNIVVCGGDIISEFTLSGFFSFQAVSGKPCKPFDAARDGISLGEGCGTIILSSHAFKNRMDPQFIIREGASSNDANHISGPSRTGDGLYAAISKSLMQSGLNYSDINYISAHGTGTIYNDEMETKALALANMLDIPVNSLKGYYGHTLGAAGVIETIISIGSMKQNHLYTSLGFNDLGVSFDLNIIKKGKSATINHSLKLASGFGGCNAALVISKNEN
jgi:3-oxoacyl-[acyl-carrier-protein] synthase-1